MGRVNVVVLASNDVLEAGTVACLGRHHLISVRSPEFPDPDVMVVIEERVTATLIAEVSARRSAVTGHPPALILVTDALLWRHAVHSAVRGVLVVLPWSHPHIVDLLVRTAVSVAAGIRGLRTSEEGSAPGEEQATGADPLGVTLR